MKGLVGSRKEGEESSKRPRGLRNVRVTTKHESMIAFYY